MESSAITPEIARELELPRGRGGAIVTNVERNSPAALAGVQPGDVILEVNRQPVTNVSQVTRELQRIEAGAPVFMVVWRGGQEVFVTMTKEIESARRRPGAGIGKRWQLLLLALFLSSGHRPRTPGPGTIHRKCP